MFRKPEIITRGLPEYVVLRAISHRIWRECFVQDFRDSSCCSGQLGLGLTPGEWTVVNGRAGFLSFSAFAQGTRVDRSKSNLLDQFHDNGLGLFIVAGDENCLAILDRGIGPSLARQSSIIDCVEGLHQPSTVQTFLSFFAGC